MRSLLLLPLLLIAACRSSAPSTTTTAPSASSATASTAPTSASAPEPSPPAPAQPPQLGLPEEWASRPATKSALVLADRSDRVENGDVYEVARVELPERVQEILAPSGTRVVRAPAGSARTLFVATEKRMRFAGHPPEPITLEGVRANMGCASKVEGDTLKLGTFGEWSNKEGAASIRLVVRIPPGVRLGMMSELGGDKSIAGHGEGRSLGHWYAPSAPAAGWERVTLELDPRHLAGAP